MNYFTTLKTIRSNLSRIKLRNINSVLKEPGSVQVYTDRSKLKEHQLRKSWYIEYSGEGTPKDIDNEGFALEYYGENAKLTMLFEDFDDFEQEVRQESSSTNNKTCWVCGTSPLKSVSSFKAVESEVIFDRLGITIMDNTENTGYICQDCQEDMFRTVVNHTDLIESSEVITSYL